MQVVASVTVLPFVFEWLLLKLFGTFIRTQPIIFTFDFCFGGGAKLRLKNASLRGTEINSMMLTAFLGYHFSAVSDITIESDKIYLGAFIDID